MEFDYGNNIQYDNLQEKYYISSQENEPAQSADNSFQLLSFQEQHDLNSDEPNISSITGFQEQYGQRQLAEDSRMTLSMPSFLNTTPQKQQINGQMIESSSSGVDIFSNQGSENNQPAADGIDADNIPRQDSQLLTKSRRKEKKKQDTQNICPKIQRYLCEYIKKEHSQLYQECFVKKNILQTRIRGNKKVNGSTETLRHIFMDSRLQLTCINYLSGPHFIRDLANRTRLKDKRVLMKYLNTFILGAINPEKFDRIKVIL